MADTVTVEQENTGVNTPQDERTFTQAEVDNIVSTRIGKERAKYSDYEELKAKAEKYNEIEEANKSELQKANERADALQSKLDAMESANKINAIRTEVSTKTGVPINLLTASTVEECEAQAQAILSFAKVDSYPSVRDAGEVTVTTSKTKEDQFGDWLNSQFK